MDSSEDQEMAWSEADSLHFIDRGQIHTPMRGEIRETILDLIPAEREERFLAVELGTGSGWLSEAILERFPRARVLGLDGSPAMLKETRIRLQRFEGRFELQRFQLGDTAWRAALGANVRCCVSSLVIHHLDAAGKQALYRDLYGHLEANGAVLIADLVAPRSERERRYMSQRWDAEVKRQSLAITGSLDAHQEFVERHSNWYEYPDPMDMPSSVPDHLTWLSEAGFVGVDVFWARAGHAIYGGYKEQQE